MVLICLAGARSAYIRVLALYAVCAAHYQLGRVGGSSRHGLVIRVHLENADIKCWLMRIKLTNLAANEVAPVAVDGSRVSLEFMDVQLRSAGGTLRLLFPHIWPQTGVLASDNVGGQWGSTPHGAGLWAHRLQPPLDDQRCAFSPQTAPTLPSRPPVCTY